jgi:hypothetical protein
MKAPYFNTNNLPETWGSVEWMNAVVAEEHRCCDDIDARYSKLNSEYVNLCRQRSKLDHEKASTNGIFACICLHFKTKSIDSEMKWRRDVMDELIDARIARTYGGK